jgi:hypothetical protein
MATSLKIGINADAKAFVEKRAHDQGVSEAEVVRRALEAYRLLGTVEQEDGGVVLRRSNGELERLIRL